MRKTCRALAISLATVAIAGCSLLNPAVPKCSDPETLDLVRQILAGNIGVEGAGKLSAATLRTLLAVELPHATQLEENIRKYSCEASLVVAGGRGASHKISIRYSSQLDDDHRHLVQVAGVSGLDALVLTQATRSAVQALQEPATTGNASGQPPAAPATVAEEVSQPVEVPAEPEPGADEIAENTRIRQAIFNGEGGNPTRADYPVDSVYAGAAASLDMSDPAARTFRTRLSAALSEGQIQFAGEYIATGWGCGTSCFSAALINKRTGKLLQKGFGGESGPRIVAMDPTSRLLVAEGGASDDNDAQTGNFAFFYVLEGDELRLIKRVPVPPALQDY